MSPFGFVPFSSTFTIIFFIAFATILTIIIVVAIKGVAQWNKNNNSPRLTVPATIVAKRTNVSSGMSGADNMHTSSTTYYYITFQVQSGDRMEYHVPDHEYGMLAEGDNGLLTFQGTRYLSFTRQSL